MGRMHDIKTILSFLVFGSASVFIITMDITLREHRENLKQAETHFVNSGILDSVVFNATVGEVCSNSERRQAYLATCAKRKWGNRNLPDNRAALQNILYNDDEEIIFCSSPALLNSFPHKLNKNTSDIVHQESPRNNMKSLADLSPNEVVIRSRQYQKLILVRHPLHEIAPIIGDMCAEKISNISGFPDLLSVNPEEKNSSSAILSAKGTSCGRDDFLEVLKTSKSFFDLCRPCDIEYDYVLKAETLSIDIDRLSESSVPLWAIIDRNIMIGSHIISTDAADNLFDTITASKSGAVIRNFAKDFELFGYSTGKKDHIKCELNIGGNKCC